MPLYRGGPDGLQEVPGTRREDLVQGACVHCGEPAFVLPGDRSDEPLSCSECDVKRLVGAEAAAAEDELPWQWIYEIEEQAPPDIEWMWDGYLAPGAVTMLAGKPKAGKSTLAWALAEAVASEATTFLGRNVGGGPVLYVTEEGASTLLDKLPGTLPVRVLTRDTAFPKPPWAKLITAAVAEAEITSSGLLIIDALSFWAGFTEGQENDPAAAQAVLDALGRATSSGLAVLLVHHQRKAGGEHGESVRGTTAIFGAVDALAELERVEDATPGQRRLVGVSRWAGQTPAVLLVDRDPELGAWRVIGEAADRAETARLGMRARLMHTLPDEPPGVPEKDLADLLELDPRKVSGPLRELLRDGIVERAGRGVPGHPYRYSLAKSPTPGDFSGGESPPGSLPPPKGEGTSGDFAQGDISSEGEGTSGGTSDGELDGRGQIVGQLDIDEASADDELAERAERLAEKHADIDGDADLEAFLDLNARMEEHGDYDTGDGS